MLSANYVEADDATFRFDYTAAFLLWALTPPGWKKDWHLGIRVVKTKKMVAFISGVPAQMNVNQKYLALLKKANNLKGIKVGGNQLFMYSQKTSIKETGSDND